jgi:hypothetical protein
MSEHAALVRRIVTTGDALTPAERDALGGAVQLRFPLRDRLDLRRQAEALRMLAGKFEALSTQRISDYEAGMRARTEVRVTQARLSRRR